METLETYFLNSNKLNGKGKYHKIGTGESLILLHGFAETYEIWDSIYPALAEKYSVLIPEIPSCGNATSFKQNFSLEVIANFINEILITEKVEKTILFGHSMGGYAAMAFAELYPENLNALSLVHSSALADSADKKKIRESAIRFISKNGKEPFIKTLIPKLYASTFSDESLKIKHFAMFNQYTDQQIIDCYQAMKNRPNRISVLKELDSPIQLIGGKEDQSVHYQDLKEQATECKNPFLTLFDDISHTSMHENPSLLIESIFGFLDDIKQTKYS
jgi:pimeloyl-ACP methyl ester carboxylesterase